MNFDEDPLGRFMRKPSYSDGFGAIAGFVLVLAVAGCVVYAAWYFSPATDIRELKTQCVCLDGGTK
jgi:hypothetical protein